MLNINVGYNKELLVACKTLGDYAEFVHRVRVCAETMSIEVDRTIGECIREDILREFLEKNRAEAKSMSIYEYNQEEHIKLEREDAFEDGLAEGIVCTARKYNASEEEIIKQLMEELSFDEARAKVIMKEVQ